MKRLIMMDIVISILDIVFLAALVYVIHFYTQPSPAITYDFFPFTFFHEHPLSLILAFFALFVLKNWLGYLVIKLQYKYVYAVASRLSKKNLLLFLEGRYSDHVNTDSSVLIHKISHEPAEFGHHVLAGLQQIIGQSILVVLTIIAILIYSPLLLLLLLLILTPPVIIMAVLIKRRSNTIRRSAKPFKERSLQHLQEALSGYVESNIYQRNDFFVDRYDRYQSRFNDFLSQQLALQNLPARFLEVFALFGLLALIVINFYSTDKNTVELVTIGAFMAAAYKIIPGAVKILNRIGQVKTFGYTIHNLLPNSSLNTAKNKEDAGPIVSLEMKGIHFSHKEDELLKDLSLEIKKGDLVGITGRSGKGKTTLVNLLLGFLEPSSGSILINDKITTAAQRSNYWKKISYVKQHSFLLHDSIMTNITLGDQDTDRLADIMKITGVDVVASQYRGGLDNLITEDGKNISGGQRQRIAMARALYKNADLLILDEPFNELDKASENQLLQYCKELAVSGKMVILITHDKESLSLCNKIISLDGN